MGYRHWPRRAQHQVRAVAMRGATAMSGSRPYCSSSQREATTTPAKTAAWSSESSNYESPAGIARHWQDAMDNWPDMSSAVSAWSAKATVVTLHNGTAVQALW